MTHPPSSNDNQDYALPSHFFDSEATQIAQPVKPLTAAVVSAKGEPKPVRRSWMLGAIAVSALVGSLVTVAAVSFYQRRSGNTPNQQATTPAAVTAPTPELITFPSPSPAASPSNIAVSMDEIDEPVTSPSPDNTAASRSTLTEARRTEHTDNSNAANDSVKNAKDKADDKDTARRTTTTTAEKQPKKDESIAADKNAEREAEERRAAERATAERLAAERAAARREEAKHSANEDRDEEPRPRKVGKRGDDANNEDEEPVAPPQRRSADRLRRIFEGERRPRQRRNQQEGTSERVRGIFEGQPPR